MAVQACCWVPGLENRWAAEYWDWIIDEKWLLPSCLFDRMLTCLFWCCKRTKHNWKRMCDSFADKVQRWLHKIFWSFSLHKSIWSFSLSTVAHKIGELPPRKWRIAVLNAQPEGVRQSIAVSRSQPVGVRQSGERGMWHTSCAHMAPGPHSLAKSPGRSGTGNHPECCSLLLCSLRLQFAPVDACISGGWFVNIECACWALVWSKTCSTGQEDKSGCRGFPAGAGGGRGLSVLRYFSLSDFWVLCYTSVKKI